VLITLTITESRVIGCLIEKSVTTPDQYPLTLNALTNACNQKSARNPIMSLQQGEVQRTVRDLATKHLVMTEENFKRGTEKYIQRFCNSRFSDYQFDAPQLAIVCLLLLRGAQTPGELRARAGRLCEFEDNGAASVRELMEREAGPLIVKLPRMPGRKDSEYMHLFSGPVDVEERSAEFAAVRANVSTERVNSSDLAERVALLEEEMAEVKAALAKSSI